MSDYAKAKAADQLFDQKKYALALPLYEEADSETPNPMIKFKLGEC